MLKFLFKLIIATVCIVAILVSLYFLFVGGGIELFKDMIKDGFWNFVKTFFIDLWNGFRSVLKI